MLVLKRDRGRADAYLHVTGREIEEEAELALRWDADLASWTLAGNAEEYRLSEERQAVLDVLGRAGGPMSPKEIAEALDKSVGSVKVLLGEMVKAGFSGSKGAFTQSYGSEALDASLLLIPLVGFLPASDPRVAGTVAAVERELLRDGFVLRYATGESTVAAPAGHVAADGGGEQVDHVDGLPPGEGAFLACTFWLVDNYILVGRQDEAERLFERLVGLANDVGLLAEEYDPAAGRQLGNFPQAFSHLSLINTAYNLTRGQTGPAEQRRQ